MKQKPTKWLLVMYWSWTVLFYVIGIWLTSELNLKSYGEQKIAMLALMSFLFLMHCAIYLSIAVNNLSFRYFNRTEFAFWLGGIIISVLFFLALRNNSNIIIG